MEKLVNFFRKRRVTQEDAIRQLQQYQGETTLGFDDFPVLTSNEESEIFDALQVPEVARSTGELKRLLVEALAKSSTVVASSPSKPQRKQEEEDNFGTVKYGTIVTSPRHDPYGTVRILDEEEEMGTVRLVKPGAKPDINTRPPTGEKKAEENAGLLAPWQLKIIALDRGEWLPIMDGDNAFRRWKKDRKKLTSSLFVPSPADKPVSTTAGANDAATETNNTPVHLSALNLQAKIVATELMLHSMQFYTEFMICASVSVPISLAKTVTSNVLPRSLSSGSLSSSTNTVPCCWVISRRYSQFYDFHCELLKAPKESDYPSSASSLFPQKKLIGNNFAKEFIESRRVALETWLQKVISLQDSQYVNNLIIDFLKLEMITVELLNEEPNRTFEIKATLKTSQELYPKPNAAPASPGRSNIY
eukprot:TRINITY_DN3240_c0_g1_i3.p1 TRINITY_DN3240_c0_g1~~TRINITY_DN3240_c0_g1_i3.p1  ORF type:complete len:418 (+),score=115.78 TRINITY_DN3240_c0_g1_i3:83-1336(+)